MPRENFWDKQEKAADDMKFQYKKKMNKGKKL